ncbi:MAG: hypothetical protein LUC45_00185, partial [Paraprevotella sp.]|nr:hypothetical protein [Paraprevotella sp.]
MESVARGVKAAGGKVIGVV